MTSAWIRIREEGEGRGLGKGDVLYSRALKDISGMGLLEGSGALKTTLFTARNSLVESWGASRFI